MKQFAAKKWVGSSLSIYYRTINRKELHIKHAHFRILKDLNLSSIRLEMAEI